MNNIIFKSIGRFFRWLFGREDEESFRRISRFSHFLDEAPEGSPEYAPAHETVVLCDESLTLVARRLALTEQLKQADERLEELECYMALSPDDERRLKSLFERHKSLTRDKAVLTEQVVSFSGPVQKVKDIEEKAPGVVLDIEDAERTQRAFKNDVAVLQGEKSALEDDYEKMRAAMGITRKFTYALVGSFALAAVIMAMLFVFAETWVLLPATVAVIAVSLMGALLYILRRRLRHEMERNAAKRRKAVSMLNRKSAVYAHYTGFLNHQYRKYSVRNAEMLKKNVREYAHYKHLTKRLDSVRNILYQTEEELEGLIKSRKIPNAYATLEKFIQAVDVDDKRTAHYEAAARKAALEKSLSEVEIRQSKIWLELDQLAAVGGKLPARIIAAYEAAAERLIEKNEIEAEERPEEREDGENTGEKLQPEY
jgi:hypothetical protein